MRSVLRLWHPLCLALATAAAAACSAADGPTGAAQQRDTTDDFVAARAQQGLAISPVPLNLAGKTDDEVQLIGYGSYLVNAVAPCSDCHTNPATPTKFLAGGRSFSLDTSGHVVFARNLTPDATTGLPLSKDQFVEALRTGKDFHAGASTRLVVMPWPSLRWMSRGDMEAIYAYLQVIPPVTNALPPDNKNGIGLPASVDYTGTYEDGDVTRKVSSDPGDPAPNSVRGLDVTPFAIPDALGANRNDFGRGSYLVTMGICGDCHSNRTTESPLARGEGRDPYTLKLDTEMYLGGGRIFTTPPPNRVLLKEVRGMSADLIGQDHGFFHEDGSTFDRFRDVIRTGTHVDENPARPLGFPMPWATFRNMVDDDLHAIYVYLSNTPAHTGAGDKHIQDYARYCTSNADCRTDETCYPNPANGNVGECLRSSCSADTDCDACQSCVNGACVAPTAATACIHVGE